MTLHILESNANADEGSAFQEAYRLERVLGSGGFGEVWSCVDRCTGEAAACKVAQKADLGREGRHALDREIGLLQRLRGVHPGIVGFKGAYETQDAVQIVMELCSGGDLFDLLQKKGPLPESSARVVFCQLADALDACHSRGIIHRDIKPENILLDRPATSLFLSSIPPAQKRALVQAKLADFGLSVQLKPGDTTTGPAGSPFYVAPEMILGRPYGRRVDVWSLGVVLCIMLTRRLPFCGRTSGDLEGLQRAIFRGRVDFSLPCWRGVSAEARDLISRMLQVDPQQRIRTHELLAHPWCAVETAQECSASQRAQIPTSYSAEAPSATQHLPSPTAASCVSANDAAEGAVFAASSAEATKSGERFHFLKLLPSKKKQQQQQEEGQHHVSGSASRSQRSAKGLLSLLGLRPPKPLVAY